MRLRRVLRQLNARALILEATHCRVDLAHIINTGRFDIDKVGSRGRAGWVR
jgi:G3E family GTPase